MWINHADLAVTSVESLLGFAESSPIHTIQPYIYIYILHIYIYLYLYIIFNILELENHISDSYIFICLLFGVYIYIIYIVKNIYTPNGIPL